MTFFILLSMYIASIGIATLMWRSRPWLLLRPSFWIAVAMIIFICGAAVFLPDSYAYEGMPPIGFYGSLTKLRFLCLSFPLVLFVAINLTPSLTKEALRTYRHCSRVLFLPQYLYFGRREKITVTVFFILTIIILAMYFYYVPITLTGFYSFFFDQKNAMVMREDSLKLIPNPLVAYTYAIFRILIAPVLISLLLFKTRGKFSREKFINILLGMTLLFLCLLPGDRAAGGHLLITIGMTFFLLHGPKKGLRVLLLLGILSLVFAATLTVLREGKNLSIDTIIEYLFGNIGGRTFGIPFVTGVFRILFYEQTNINFFQTSKILSYLFNVKFVDVANMSGKFAASNAIDSVHMNTAYFFDNIGCFDFFWGFLISVFFTLILDYIIYLFKGIFSIILIVCLSCMLQTMINGVTSSISLGMIAAPLLAWLLSYIRQIDTSVPSTYTNGAVPHIRHMTAEAGGGQRASPIRLRS